MTIRGFLGLASVEEQVKWSLPDAHTDFIIMAAEGIRAGPVCWP
jgi:hypothetical protein